MRDGSTSEGIGCDGLIAQSDWWSRLAIRLSQPLCNSLDLLLVSQLPAVVACGGTWMVKPDMIAAGDFKAITALSAEAVKAAAGS